MHLRGLEVTGQMKKLYSAELHNLYQSPVIVRIFKIKQSEMGKLCSTHTDSRHAYKLCLENLKVREHLKDPSINGRALFKQILKKQNCKMWNGFILLRTGISRNDLSVPQREFLSLLNNY